MLKIKQTQCLLTNKVPQSYELKMIGKRLRKT